MTARTVPAGNGISLWSESLGDPDGPVVLLVMGGNLSAFGWPDELLDRLAGQGLRVLRYDHRDTGRSSCVDFERDPYTIDTLTTDAVAVLDAWDVAAAHVVGMSLGGTIVQLLALDHPARVWSLTVLNSGALDVAFDDAVERAMNGQESADGLPLPGREFLDVLELMSTDTGDELERRVTKWRLLAGRAPFDEQEFRDRERRAAEHAGRPDEPIVHHLLAQPPAARGAELATVRVRTLAVQALCDPVAPPPHARHLAGLVPDGHVVEIPEMGHALTSSAAVPLADAIVAHVRSVTPTRLETP